MVLVEGKNDLNLCKSLLKKSGILENKVYTFVNKGEKEDKKNQETIVLNKLSEKNSPMKWWLK